MHEIKKIILTETQKEAIKKLLAIKYPSFIKESNEANASKDSTEDNK